METRKIKILGTPVARVTYESAFDVVQDLARESRPTMIQISNAELEKKFGRKV